MPKPAVQRRGAARSMLIEVRDVEFGYPTSAGRNVSVLRGFSFEVYAGEFLCLLGPSGCGKTTALRLAAGFDAPSGGRVTLEGRQVTGPSVERGVVFQADDSLFNWLNARANVAFGLKMRGVPRKKREQVAERFLALVGLTGHGGKFPSELSGGMKQRIQIARILANDPKVLLMDEPFGALDAQTRAELQDELVRIWSETGKTILFITHDIGEALLLADRVGVMTRGPEARIRAMLEIDLPRPRSRASVRFGELYEQVQQMIVEEVKHARQGLGAGG